MNDLPIIAIDDGYAEIKSMVLRPDNGPLYQSFASAVKTTRTGMTSLDNSYTSRLYDTPEGERMMVTDQLNTESTLFNDYHTSVMNRVLVNDAVMRQKLGGQPVHIVVGLPVKDYYANGQTNESLVEAKRKNLMKPIKIADGAPAPVIEYVTVVPQALAAYIDFRFDFNLRTQNADCRRIAVFDIGGGTTDIAIINNNQIDHDASGSIDLGVLSMFRELSSALNSKFDTDLKLPLSDIRDAVTTKKVRLWGEDKNIGTIVGQYLHSFTGQLTREAKRRLGNAATIDTILLVGGGARCFPSTLEGFPNAQVVQDPSYANVRGYYKAAKMRSVAERKVS